VRGQKPTEITFPVLLCSEVKNVIVSGGRTVAPRYLGYGTVEQNEGLDFGVLVV